VGDPLQELLVRQLRRAGISDDGEGALAAAPSEEAWQRFVRSVDEHYRNLEDDRTLLVRTSELAAAEVNEIRQQMLAQRDAMQTTLGSIAHAVGALGKIAASAATTENAAVLSALDGAKIEMAKRLEQILAEGEHPGRAALTGLKAHLAQLADELGRMHIQSTDGARLQKELTEAGVVQALIVPPETPFVRPAATIAGVVRQAAACGGDFWTVEEIGAERLLVLVGDVTGHGLAAAIVSGAAKAASHMACATVRERDSDAAASGVLRAVNEAIHDAARREVMMTCSAGVIDPATRTMTLANAGHTFTYLVRVGIARPVIVHGPPLGAGPAAEYDTTSVSLQPGDLLVWFSDGVIEAENAAGEQFTEKRLRALCQRLAKDGAVATRDGILEVLTDFRGDAEQADDITIVAATIG